MGTTRVANRETVELQRYESEAECRRREQQKEKTLSSTYL